jgi:WD40 repeat protein/Mrp family chromosome partitioning ATPase
MTISANPIPANRPAVISFYSYKGGVGRTILAANVATDLARYGKTILWDLDVEAPSMHELRDLQNQPLPADGFFSWLIEWQKAQLRKPGEEDLNRFKKLIYATPIKNLSLLPAVGSHADIAAQYAAVKWRHLLSQNEPVGKLVFNALIDYLGELGFRYVIIDSRTGLTDLGALLMGVIPDATVLVGAYGVQNLAGLGRIFKALKSDSSELRKLRVSGSPLQLFTVASRIVQNDTQLLTTARENWAETFQQPMSSVLEIPHDPELTFSEKILINSNRVIAEGYRTVAKQIYEFTERLFVDRNADLAQVATNQDVEDHFGRKGLSTAEQGKRYEERIAHLLRLLGYKVEPEQVIDSNRIDLVASIQSGVDTVTYFVECKDYKSAVGKEIVEKLAIWLGDPKAKQMNARGMIVANAFSPQAMGSAKDKGISTQTPEALERLLLKTDDYLQQLVSNFETSKLASSYVTQQCGSVQDRGNDGLSKIENLVDYGLAWANGKGNRLWVLLGDYGTGKTAYTEKLAYELAKKALTDLTQPIPLRVNLRDLPNRVGLEDVLAAHWKRVTGQDKSGQIFKHLISRGRFTLILDSFDEMGIATAGRSVVEQFRSLISFTASSGDNALANRVLITCRDQFFRDHGEALNATVGNPDGSVNSSALQRLAEQLDASIRTVSTFTPEQIAEFLRLRLGPIKAAEAMQFLKKNSLLELGDRPQLLDIIVASLPKMQEQLARGQRRTTMGELYRIYTNTWLTEFKPVERQSTADTLLKVLEELAYELWKRVGNRIHYSDLFLLVKDRVDLRGALDPVQLDLELRTAAFLSRTADGQYGFSHRSFLEYFFARKLLASAKKESLDSFAKTLDVPRLTYVVVQFLCDLVNVGTAGETLQLKAWTKGVLSPSIENGACLPANSRSNALILAYEFVQLAIEQSATTDADSVEQTFSEWVPTQAQLQNTDLSALQFDNLVADQADFSSSSLEDSSFVGAKLNGALFTNAKARNSQWLMADLNYSRACFADFFGSNMNSAELQGVDFSNAKLLKVDFEGADLRNAQFKGADVRSARFVANRQVPNLDEAISFGATVDESYRNGATPLVVPYQIAAARPLLSEHHTSSVNSVAWSADGKRIASGGDDNTIRLWDTQTGQCVHVLEGHQETVTSVAWSADGQRIATGSDDDTIRLWDAQTGMCMQLLEEHQHPVTSVAWSADGQRIASGGHDRTIRLWDAQTGQCIHMLGEHEISVTSVAWSADGQRIASGGHDRTIRLWDAQTGRCVQVLKGHLFSVTSVAWSADGQRIASGSHDNTIRLWDAQTGQCLHVLSEHEISVTSVAWSADGQRIASGGHDRMIRLWDAQTGRCVQVLEGHQEPVTSVAWSADGQRIASGSYDNSIRLWDAQTGQCMHVLGEHEISVTSVAWSADGQRIASGSGDNTIRLWDTQTGRCTQMLEGHQEPVTSVAWSAVGEKIASGSADNTIRLWDTQMGMCMHVLEGHRSSVTSVAWSAVGEKIASGSDDNTIRLWDTQTGRCVQMLEGHQQPVTSVAWSTVGEKIASGSADNTIRLWDTQTGQCVHVLEGHQGAVMSVAWSADGHRIASGGCDDTIRLWDVQTGQCVQVLDEDQLSGKNVVWSADGKRIASGSDNNTVRLWDVQTGQCVQLLEGHRSSVTSVAWSADGQKIVSSSIDGTALIWSQKSIPQQPSQQFQIGHLLRHLQFGAWYSLDYRDDARGLWRADSLGAVALKYRDSSETLQPAPWVPRDWQARDLPELKA